MEPNDEINPGARSPYVLPPEPKKNPVRLIIVGVLVVAGLVAALVFG